MKQLITMIQILRSRIYWLTFSVIYTLGNNIGNKYRSILSSEFLQNFKFQFSVLPMASTFDKWGGLWIFPPKKWLHKKIVLFFLLFIFLPKKNSAWSWNLRACVEWFNKILCRNSFRKSLFCPKYVNL